MLLGVAFLIALLTVPLRGGHLAALGDVQLRMTWLPITAIALQLIIIVVLPGGAATAHRTVHVCSYLLIAAFVIANRHIPYLWLIGLGGASNFVAITTNGGVMPARAAALRAAHVTQNSGHFVNSTSIKGAHLQALGDIVATPGWLPIRNVVSVGDVVIALGALLAVHRICGSRAVLLPRVRRLQRSHA